MTNSFARGSIDKIWCKELFTLLAVLAFISLTIIGVLAEQQPSPEYIAQKTYDRADYTLPELQTLP